MKNITGIMIYYYFICKKRLWYFSNDLTMESESQLVGIGKMIDEESYGRERKHIMIEDLANIDFLQDWKVIHEVKKSDKLEEASIWQLKYYIYLLRNRGVDIEKGILDYPKLRKRKEIFLNMEDKIKLEEVIIEIEKIIELETPNIENKKPYCNKCSYYEFCYI